MNISEKMLLKNKLSATHMNKTDTVTSYLIKTAAAGDQIVAVGGKLEDDELVRISLNGFSPTRHNFVQIICGRKKFLTSSRCGMLSLER